MSELLRRELAYAGFSESLNFSLCSKEDLTTNLKLEKYDNAVVIENPKT